MRLNYRYFNTPVLYEPVQTAMRLYTKSREESPLEDALWLMAHEPVFTQGQAGKPEHVLAPGHIPVVQSDRGGQVTYHGPGLLMMYALVDLKPHKLGVRQWVRELESMLIGYLETYHGIQAHLIDGAPGVYVADEKIASIGLRVRKQHSYHGICLNVDGDLSPFSSINPCGYEHLKMTKVQLHDQDAKLESVAFQLLEYFAKHFGYDVLEPITMDPVKESGEGQYV